MQIWMEGVYCNLMNNTVRDTLDLSGFDPTNYGADEGATVPLDDIQTGIMFLFFSIWIFFHEHSRITGLQGKGEGISLTPHYHFHPLHRHLDISRAIAAESSPLYIASSRT